jgi:hypothetical protein
MGIHRGPPFLQRHGSAKTGSFKIQGPKSSINELEFEMLKNKILSGPLLFSELVRSLTKH